MKGAAKREEILGVALDLIARVGYSKTTVKELAEAVGTTPALVIYHFGTKEALLAEVLKRRDELDTARYDASVPGKLAGEGLGDMWADAVRHNANVPGLVQLYARFSLEASEADHPAHAYFTDRHATTRQSTAEALRSLQEHGLLSPHIDIDLLAPIIPAVVDGLQAQWLYDPSLAMDESVRYFFELLQRLTEAERARAVGPHLS